MQYVSQWTLTDGTQVTIRPIHPEDEALMVKFHESLSNRTVRSRYFYSYSLSARTAHERLSRICFVEPDRETVLVAEHKDANSGTHEIVGVGRLSKLPGSNDAEAAVLVTDRYQRRGLGIELLGRLIEIAREHKLDRIVAEILGENLAMQLLVKRLSFKLVTADDPSVVRAVLYL